MRDDHSSPEIEGHGQPHSPNPNPNPNSNLPILNPTP